MTWLLTLLGIAAAYQLLVLGLLVVGWRNPKVVHRRDPGTLGIPFEPVTFPTEGGRLLHGWRVPSGVPGAPAVVLVHGWGRNVERMLPWIGMLHPAGFDLLVFDARNHGSSEKDGHASLPKFSRDVRAAVDHLARTAPSVPSRVGVLGLSIGGSGAIHAAARDPRIAAVVTVGAFAHPGDPRATVGRFWWLLAPGLPLAFRVVEHRIGVRLDEVAPENVIGRARAHFLLIHGSDDTVVPVAHARRLAAAAGDGATLWLMPGRGHSDPHLEPGVADRVASFFRAELADGPGTPERGEDLTDDHSGISSH